MVSLMRSSSAAGMSALRSFLVRTQPGLEGCVRTELQALNVGTPGTTSVRDPPNGDVLVEGVTARDLYLACTFVRCASRIVVPIARFEAKSFAQLQEQITRRQNGQFAPWLVERVPLDVRVKTRDSALWHEGAVRERLTRWLHGEGSLDSESAQRLEVLIVDDIVELRLEYAPRALNLHGLFTPRL